MATARNAFLFIAGLTGVIYEALLHGASRPAMLMVFVALMYLGPALAEFAPAPQLPPRDRLLERYLADEIDAEEYDRLLGARLGVMRDRMAVRAHRRA